MNNIMNNKLSPLMESHQLQYKSVHGTRSTKTTHHLLLPHIQKLGEQQFNLQQKDPINLYQRQILNRKVLANKGGLKVMANPNNNIKDVTKDQYEQYNHAEKFQKNHASCSKIEKGQLRITETPIFQSRQQKGHNSQSKPIITELKDNKQYIKKMNKVLGKGQQKPSSQNKTYRIAKVQNRTSKLLTDAIIDLNKQQTKLQKQILQLHKRSIKQLNFLTNKYNFTINIDKINVYLNKNSQKELNNLQGNVYCQMLVNQLSETLKLKKKELVKIETHIKQNEYCKYLLNVQEGIEEMNSSEEEDVVGELFPSQINQPKVMVDQGSYFVAMQSIKNKRYALNLRRTYEVFKSTQNSFSSHQKRSVNQQIQSQNGQNKITINSHFKDFLLS